MNNKNHEVFDMNKTNKFFREFVYSVNNLIIKQNAAKRTGLVESYKEAITEGQRQAARQALDDYKPEPKKFQPSLALTFDAITKAFNSHYNTYGTLTFRTTYRSLATMRGCSPRTVKRHIKAIVGEGFVELKHTFRSIEITINKTKSFFRSICKKVVSFTRKNKNHKQEKAPQKPPKESIKSRINQLFNGDDHQSKRTRKTTRKSQKGGIPYDLAQSSDEILATEILSEILSQEKNE